MWVGVGSGTFKRSLGWPEVNVSTQGKPAGADGSAMRVSSCVSCGQSQLP